MVVIEIIFFYSTRVLSQLSFCSPPFEIIRGKQLKPVSHQENEKTLLHPLFIEN